MKITGVRVHQLDLPLREGRYTWADGKFVEVFDSTVVELVTDAGISGWGECCPLGSAYLPAHATGVRAGIIELAPQILGLDPRSHDILNRHMDRCLRGHPHVKSAIDMAAWDVTGKATGLPVTALLGGRAQESVRLYRAISQIAPAAMAENVAGYRAEGYTRFQLKVGGDADADIERIRLCAAAMAPGEVLVADANTGWSMREAARVVAAVRNLDVHIEQPCPSYEECLVTRRRTALPFILDEVIQDLPSFLRALHDGAMDAINLKISKLGGLTRARQLRDLCVACGIPMTIEDSWGGDIVTAAIAHLAASTPEEFCFTATDFNSYTTVELAPDAPRRVRGRMAPSDAPGLGVTPDRALLGAPVWEI